MSNFVLYRGQIYPRSHFDVTTPKPVACPVCFGKGVLIETFDDDRLDIATPCTACRAYCATCKRYREKGHECGAVR